jgi:hypothetical protein
MKSILISLLLVGASALAAQAETFTFTSVGTTQNAINAPVLGDKPVMAVFIETKATITYASGKAATNLGHCASWSTTPGSTFEIDGACVDTESNGDQDSIVYGCDYADKERTKADCWGYLTGMSGGLAGKSGTISWHQSISPDGKGAANGVGQWNN